MKPSARATLILHMVCACCRVVWARRKFVASDSTRRTRYRALTCVTMSIKGRSHVAVCSSQETGTASVRACMSSRGIGGLPEYTLRARSATHTAVASSVAQSPKSPRVRGVQLLSRLQHPHASVHQCTPMPVRCKGHAWGQSSVSASKSTSVACSSLRWLRGDHDSLSSSAAKMRPG